MLSKCSTRGAAMDVEDFVSSIIDQIMEGVADTLERARALGG